MRSANRILGLSVLSLVLGLTLVSSKVWAEDTTATSAKTYTWTDKAKRGSLNIVSSPVEIARQIQITSEEKNLLQGWTVGLIEGVFQGVVRLGAGVVDLVTCPFDFPKAGKAPLVDPEYVWEKPGVKYTS